MGQLKVASHMSGLQDRNRVERGLTNINLLWACGLDLSGSGYWPPIGSFEHGNKPSGYIKGGKFLTIRRLSDSQEGLCMCVRSDRKKQMKRAYPRPE
jgi:hypothetical protein